jgi:hypothetical protein
VSEGISNPMKNSYEGTGSVSKWQIFLRGLRAPSEYLPEGIKHLFAQLPEIVDNP